MAGDNNEKISAMPLASDVQADDNIPATPITPGVEHDNQPKNAKVSPTPAPSDNKKQSKTRSERQREASRANGKQSRGPNTERGKSNSRFNALKHGILSRYAAISHPSALESPEEFQEIQAEFVEDLKPVGRMERTLVELIAVNYLRLGRATRYEAAQLNKALVEDPPSGVYVPHCGVEEVTAAIEEVEKNGYFSQETKQELTELKTIPPGIFSLNAKIVTARGAEGNLEDDVQLLLEALGTELRFREHLERELDERDQLRKRISVHQLALPAEHEGKKIRRYQKPVLREIFQALQQLKSLQRRRLQQLHDLNDSAEWKN